MYKYETQLAFFKVRESDYSKGDYTVTWYVLEKEIDGEKLSRCFTMDELKEFEAFVLTHPDNFPGTKQYRTCIDEEITPECGFYSFIPNSSLAFPENVIISQGGKLEYVDSYYPCMNIILTDTNGTNKRDYYKLSFDVVGVLPDGN